MVVLLLLTIVYLGVLIGMRTSEYTIPLWICFAWPIILIWLIGIFILQRKEDNEG